MSSRWRILNCWFWRFEGVNIFVCLFIHIRFILLFSLGLKLWFWGTCWRHALSWPSQVCRHVVVIPCWWNLILIWTSWILVVQRTVHKIVVISWKAIIIDHIVRVTLFIINRVIQSWDFLAQRLVTVTVFRPIDVVPGQIWLKNFTVIVSRAIPIWCISLGIWIEHTWFIESSILFEQILGSSCLLRRSWHMTKLPALIVVLIVGDTLPLVWRISRRNWTTPAGTQQSSRTGWPSTWAQPARISSWIPRTSKRIGSMINRLILWAIARIWKPFFKQV